MSAKADPGTPRSIRRGLRSLAAVAALAMFFATMALTTLPAMHRAASDRTDTLAARLESRISDLRTDAERLIRVGTDWLAGGDLALDHRSLNRRFMPVLDRLEEIDSVRIADTAGNEWMLRRQAGGTWLNRLSGAAEPAEGRRRFLTWKRVDQLIEDRQRPSDYQPTTQDWFQKAARTRPGTLAWTQVRRLPDSDQPGIMVAMRLPTADSTGLVIAVALRLTGLHGTIARLPLGESGQAALLTAQGQLLDFSASTGLERSMHGMTSMLTLETQPLRQAFDHWLGRDKRGRGQHMLIHQTSPWYLGYRPLALGTENLWLLSLLPAREILPGLWLRMAALAGLFILILLLSTLMATRLVRRAPGTSD